MLWFSQIQTTFGFMNNRFLFKKYAMVEANKDLKPKINKINVFSRKINCEIFSLYRNSQQKAKNLPLLSENKPMLRSLHHSLAFLLLKNPLVIEI